MEAAVNGFTEMPSLVLDYDCRTLIQRPGPAPARLSKKNDQGLSIYFTRGRPKWFVF